MVDKTCYYEVRTFINAIDEVLLPSLRTAVIRSGYEELFGKERFVGENSYIAPQIIFWDDARRALEETTGKLEDFLSGRNMIIIEDATEEDLPQYPKTMAPSPIGHDVGLEDILKQYLEQITEYAEANGEVPTPMDVLNDYARTTRDLLIQTAFAEYENCRGRSTN